MTEFSAYNASMERVIANLSGRVRRTKLQGREYIVAPLTLIVPGVLNGSQGPLYYPPEEVSKNPGVWNGVPVVVGHPTYQGQHVSARDPDVLNKQQIGQIFRAKSNGKLTAEGWFDLQAVERVDNRIFQALEAGKEIELSTGLFTDNEPAEKGATTNDGESYSFIARNYRPDHLAILPDQIGACSVDDGCGVNVNTGQAVMLVDSVDLSQLGPGDKFERVLADGKYKWRVFSLSANKTGIPSKGDTFMATKLSDEARKKIVDDLIANSCCWNEADREVLKDLDDGKLGQLKAQAEKDQQREVVVNAAKKGFTDPGGGTHTYNEEKGEWETKTKEPEPVVNKEDNKPKEPTKPQTTEEWMKAAPVEVRNTFQYAQAIEAKEKAALIEQLTGNVKDDEARQRLTERLQAKPLDELRDLMVLAPEQEDPLPVSYAGAAGPAANRAKDALDEDAILPLPTMNFEPEQKQA